ncbi:MAG TPA: ribonuclease III [Thermomicrobiales bacterium]|nr:ribonuclease III [Thermomicrobiales bacterium]
MIADRGTDGSELVTTDELTSTEPAPNATDQDEEFHVDLSDLERDDGRVERAMEALGVEFRNPKLMRLALVHRSFLNERGADAQTVIDQSNERLEFLGDSLIGFFSAEWVYRHYPDQPEGVLTAHRVSLVRTETLAEWARGFGLHDLTYMARGELGPNGEVRARLLAGSLEAALGAIYLDRGMTVARRFVHRLFTADASRRIEESEATNYKGRLQELIQERERVTPGYRTVKASGPAHDREFVVEAVLRGRPLGSGTGPNKRAAEQEAARNALERLALEGIGDLDGRTV